MREENYFTSGFKAMLPITTGIIPFGAVVGTVSADAQMSFFQTVSMNFLAFAGASQLAAIDLMTKNAASVVVIVTGLIINLRFLLYSAAMSPIVHRSSALTRLFCAYSLTDQSYAVMTANEAKLKTNAAATTFYIGSCVCMLITWHSSVMAGYAFGNFAPASLSLDFAIPLSFVALVMPTLKNKKYVSVALFSGATSVILHPLPYKLGLLLTALLSIILAIVITRKKVTV